MKTGIWQLCPKCNGIGEVYVNEAYKNITSARIGYIQCDLCYGAKIINELTGQPPIGRIKNAQGLQDYNIKES